MPLHLWLYALCLFLFVVGLGLIYWVCRPGPKPPIQRIPRGPITLHGWTGPLLRSDLPPDSPAPYRFTARFATRQSARRRWARRTRKTSFARANPV
jgi:hypothetical protein